MDDEVAQRRAVLRLVPYGLFVVTVRQGDEHSGFTANWLTQVSFDPPLLALSVQNDSHSIGMIRSAGLFTINVLPRDAVELAGDLGKRWAKVPDKLSKIAWEPGPNGCAVLGVALAHIDCAVESESPAGDSTLFVVRVARARMLHEGEPLRMSDTPYKHAG